MNTETFAKYKDKLEAIASELGYTLHADMLDSENDWWPWSLVRLMSGTAALPDIHHLRGEQGPGTSQPVPPR
jgi:hypothetical protein